MDDLELGYYRKFRTGYAYMEVSDMLWSYSDDPSTWHVSNAVGKKVEGKRKGTLKKVGTRRHSILGKWREIKLEMWARVLHECGGLEGYIKYLESLKTTAYRAHGFQAYILLKMLL